MKAEAPIRATAPRLPASVGDLIDGKYRVESVLGAGGMGVVLGAMHLKLQQPVALKFLLPAAAADELTRARFDREGRAVAQIESDHVARVMDVESLPDGTPYLVLEHLTGRDLADLMDVRGALPVEEAVDYILQACDAIAEAHAIGIVHRDLKPENLFLAERADGSRIVKVIDFGISKVNALSAAYAAPGRDTAVTRTTSVVGSPMYMSPEQLRSARDVDGRSDIWSLSVTLYELLSAQAPFPWGTVPEVCAAVLKDQPVPLAERMPQLPPELCAAIEHGLEKNKDLRWPDIATFAAAIAPFGRSNSGALLDRIFRVSLRGPRQVSSPQLVDCREPTLVFESSDVLKVPVASLPSGDVSSIRAASDFADRPRVESTPSMHDAPVAVLPARVSRRGVKVRAAAIAAAIATLASIGVFTRSTPVVAPALHLGPVAIWVSRASADAAIRAASTVEVAPPPIETPEPIAPRPAVRAPSRSSVANSARAFEHRK